MKWWRVFLDKITGKSSAPAASGPRRRKDARFGYEVKVTAKCSSWPKFVDLFTGNVSAGGLYVPSDQDAEVGETIEVGLSLPDGTSFPLTGTVVNTISAEQAAKFGKKRGLGVKLDTPEGEAKVRFEQLLATAKGDAPMPPKSPITPTGSVRLSAVHEAVNQLGLAGNVGAAEPADAGIDIDMTEEPAAPPPTPTPKPAAPAIIKSANPIIGVDLGTTYTSVSAVIGKKVSILEWPDGSKSSPSVVSFPDAHSCVVGHDARNRMMTDPLHTVASPKRLLGRKHDDREIAGFIGQAPFQTIAGPDGSVVVEIWNQPYAITQLVSYFLVEARKIAEAALGTEVSRCVMTCPVSFDEERTRLLRRAGQLAHLDVVELIDEPSAAALANRFDPNFGGVVGVYDFGGGTFDFSVVDVTKGDFMVMATAGDTWLGGDDFDALLGEAAANQFWREHNVDLRKQAVEWQKLLFACEKAKRQLSLTNETEIAVPEILRTADGMIDLRLSLDRASFEQACRPAIDRSLATCDQALELLDMKPTELTTVYLSGGTTYIPAVREALAEHFKVPIRTGVPPEHSVCLGAAIHAAQLQFQAGRTTLDARED